MFRSGLETLPNVPEGWESLPDVCEWSKGYPKCPGVVWRPSQMSGSGQQTLPYAREWWEALTDVWEACHMSGRGREAYPNV